MVTCTQIWAATIFIDYATDFIHVALMNDQSGDATLQAKHDFENLATEIKGRFCGRSTAVTIGVIIWKDQVGAVTMGVIFVKVDPRSHDP